MAARAGVSRDDVIAAAVSILDGGDQPGVGVVARRLGIRPQSLYAHVDGIEDLERAVALVGLEALADEVTDAAVGRAGADAVRAIVRAHLACALSRPGLYLAAIRPAGDDEAVAVAIRAVNLPLESVLDSLGVSEEEQVHWIRLVLATISGYVALRRGGRLALPVDPAGTEERLVAMLVDRVAESGRA